MSIGSEAADLFIFLCVVCVPLAVGAVFIPIGRALADRIRSDRSLRADHDAIIRALQLIDARVGALEQAAASNATAIERLAARRLPELPAQRFATTPHPNTPH